MDKSLKRKASKEEVAPCTFIVSANHIVDTCATLADNESWRGN